MASSVSGARVLAIAHQMQLAASMEGKPNHVQHVKDQIDYSSTDLKHLFWYNAHGSTMNLENGIKQEVLRKGLYNAKENPQTHNDQRGEDLDFR